MSGSNIATKGYSRVKPSDPQPPALQQYIARHGNNLTASTLVCSVRSSRCSSSRSSGSATRWPACDGGLLVSQRPMFRPLRGPANSAFPRVIPTVSGFDSGISLCVVAVIGSVLSRFAGSGIVGCNYSDGPRRGGSAARSGADQGRRCRAAHARLGADP